MKLTDLLDRYASENPGLSGTGLAQYKIAVRGFAKFLSCEPILNDLTSANIATYMKAMLAMGRKERTANNKRATLIMLSAYAESLELIPRAVKVKKLDEEETIPNALSVEEMTRIIYACRRCPKLPIHVCEYHKNLWLPRHWEGLIRTIWETGHRLGALLECPRSALRNGILMMPARLTKTKREQRHKLSISLTGMLCRLPKNDLLFPWPLARQAIWEKLDKHVLKPAGIPCDRYHKFHCLRRTSASHLLRAVGDISIASRHLGHSNTQVTTARYIDPSVGYVEVSAGDLLPSIAGPAAVKNGQFFEEAPQAVEDEPHLGIEEIGAMFDDLSWSCDVMPG